MELISYSKRLTAIVSNDTKLEKIATGFTFIEGPIWEKNKERLLFSDIPANKIYTWDEKSGVQLYREPSGQSNGLTLDQKGRLLACEHKNRRVSLTELNGEVLSIATHFKEKRLNSPNDIVVKSDGMLYFTDPPYGLEREQQQELPFQGVYRLDPTTNQLSLLIDDFDRPNGLAFSPDEKTLYIDDSARQHVRSFTVNEDGSLRDGRLFAQLDPSVGPGVPDGLKVDQEGHIYVTGPGGVWIFSPEGEKLGILLIPEIAANLAWGDEDYSTLYITASTSLYRLRTNVNGIKP